LVGSQPAPVGSPAPPPCESITNIVFLNLAFVPVNLVPHLRSTTANSQVAYE
jgi:hypothetical protein